MIPKFARFMELNGLTNSEKTVLQSNSAVDQKPFLSDLPVEIVLKILKNLSLTDVLSMGWTCKGMREVSEIQKLWKSFLNKMKLGLDKKYFTSYKSQCLNIINYHAITLRFHETPAFLFEEKFFALRVLKKYGGCLGYFPKFCDDREVVLAAVKSGIFVLINASNRLQKADELIKHEKTSEEAFLRSWDF